MFSIRYKIIIIVTPLLIISMAFLAFISIEFARNGIDKIAKEFLGYKINEIFQKANTEVERIKKSDLYTQEYIDILKQGIAEYSSSITKKNIESVVAIDSNGKVQMSTDTFLSIGQEAHFFNKIKSNPKGWVSFKINGLDKVGFYRYFEEWDWYILLSVYSNMFYKDANQIFSNSIIILIISIIVMVILLVFFINLIFKPLQTIVFTMNDIIKLNDMSKRVPVMYSDEIGELADTFNNMLNELENAYVQIKEYAYQSVLAQKKEERIKLMFQKYVPQDVVDEIVHNPARALVGKNKDVTILFSDIRDFTTIAESMKPEIVVDSLNSYFTIMVDVIYKNRGVIDKYIGDAIMAVFGAPKEYPDDVQKAIYSGIEMLESLVIFNKKQKEKNLKEFKIGIGINYGPVTVGNIGTSQKMDYTVIGDAVNLASRLEGLTKEYNVPIIVSESAVRVAKNYFYFREIDRVVPVGKTKPVKIFEPARNLSSSQKKAWKLYNSAVRLFLERAWNDSEKLFLQTLSFLPDDILAKRYLDNIKSFKIQPPPQDWDGTTIMKHK